ncbi:MAG: hypothetical protein OEV90_15295 [Gammaproteobacteria bacterium]|nr:hypothetical protein [Gammaproteobacteria bacterium]MDH4313122.1 hypothetical protein [Gammaproteobacteria bacterium]
MSSELLLRFSDGDLMLEIPGAAGQGDQYPAAVAIASGLAADLAGADQRFKDAIGRAHALLNDYGISRADFEEVVRVLVLRRNKS